MRKTVKVMTTRKEGKEAHEDSENDDVHDDDNNMDCEHGVGECDSDGDITIADDNEDVKNYRRDAIEVQRHHKNLASDSAV